MPGQLKALIDDAVEEIAPDVKLAVFERADDFLWKHRPFQLRQRQGSSAAMKLSSPLVMPLDSPMLLQGVDAMGDISASVSGGGSTFFPDRARILYTIAPHDKSVWESMRNPAYLICLCIGLIPRVNILWWMLVYMLHDLNDEWQLGQFIAGFQTSRFLSQGLFGTIRGAILYYSCANRDVSTCASSGPGVRTFLDGPAFALQIVIILYCYRRLPSATHRMRKPEERSRSRVLKAAFPQLSRATSSEAKAKSALKKACAPLTPWRPSHEVVLLAFFHCGRHYRPRHFCILRVSDTRE